ncbi:uncharacterized protein EV154DRAFT_499494 [Mucor mucedo]|uniref:uncharacterized protein n=1 Tax=Mucor mucedo TaxID=29922 RepID=UPI00221FA28A|nr:uncharacterized protein EV154DRAFT_499494 [Mucor mucedo]KAI7894154.1 hypothetical protein EV154DRAFT_499494 [Mucor mucedo]
MDCDIKKPQIRLKMGPSRYFSKRSDSVTGDWNEGFLFLVSYHAQLFNTVEFDLYDKPHKHWPTTKHVGKAKLRLSKLEGKNDVFVTFLPIYEYRSKRLLPSDFQPTLLETEWIDQASIHNKVGDLSLIGSIQIRVRYKFQEPVHELIPNRNILADDEPAFLSPGLHPLTTATTRRSSYGRADLAQDEEYVDNLFEKRLTQVMSAHIPSEQSIGAHKKKKRNLFQLHRNASFQSIASYQMHWIHGLFSPAKKLPNSSSGRRFGFSQNDSDDNNRFNPDGEDDQESESSSLSSSAPVSDRFAHGARKKAQHIIDSVNFGDRNFASQWMADSFEDVALSHPIVDKLIGLVVSKQTQAMVRAIIKTANSFGQGFRVTGIKLLKSALLVQSFYESLPRPVESASITDIEVIDDACHYFAFALVAYGWRGLCYIGPYGQYARGARDRRSNRLAIIRFLQIDPEDLLGYEYALRKGASFQPSYYVALDRKRDAIVLSIRGTWSLYDAITDLVCEYMPWKGGLVHSGMLASAQWFYTNIIPQIFRYIHHHKLELKSFIITGHSLGGGTASLLTMMVADHVQELRNLADNQQFNFHCYNYAPAAVSSPDLCNMYRDYITSFVCQDDVVGRLSYGTAMKLKELVLDMISAYEMLGGFRTVSF